MFLIPKSGFLFALSFCFIISTQLIFILGLSLLKPTINNVILPNWLNFDGVKYPNAPKIICCSDAAFIFGPHLHKGKTVQ